MLNGNINTSHEQVKQWFADRPFIALDRVSKAMGWKRSVLNEKLVGKFRKPLTTDELEKLTALLKKYDGE